MAVNLFNSPSDAVMYWVERAKRFRLLMELNHAADCKKLRRTSRLSLDWDGDGSYTSKVDYVVHIGVRGSIERNLQWIHSDEDLLEVLEFVRHHEVLHLYYTGGDSYAWSVQKGAEEVMKYIATQMNNGKPVLFRKQSDVERFRRQLAVDFGGVDIVALIEQISANISNCLEDGRIERVGSSDPGKTKINPPFRGPQFATERTLNRGRNFYEYANEEFVPWEDLKDDPVNHLRVIINQILMLSKAQLYQKGFVSAYGDTKLMEEMAKINDHIRTGYMGVNTRKMAEGNFGICRELAPLIYESAKASASDIQMAQMLMQFLQQLVEQMRGQGAPANSDSDAQDDTEGSTNSALPSDDLMSNGFNLGGQGGSEGSSGGEESEDGSNSETGSNPGGQGNGTDGNNSSSDSENGGESGKGSKPGDDTEGEGSEKSGEDGNNGKTSDEGSDNGSESDDDSGKDGKSGKEEGKEDEQSDDSSSEEGKGSKQNNGSEQDTSANNPITPQKSEGPAKQKTGGEKRGSVDIDAIEQAMKQAAEQLNANNSDMVDSVNKTAKAEAEQRRADAKRTSTKIQKVKLEDVKDICPNFKELRRKYKVNEQLPAVRLQDGRTFRRWFEKFLKSKKSPAVRYRRSGKLDRGAIANLAKKDTRVFKKDSKNALRKCCVYILVDNSGSMSGAKRMLACESAGVIEEGIKYTVPTKIVAFDWYGDVIHEVIKDWDEVYTDNCCWSFALHGREGGGNDDGYDIQIATREILARPEERKILIVLSDGAPGDCDLVKRSVEKARAAGIKVCGIYFEEGDVVSYSKPFIDMYQKDYVCCTADKIQENLTHIVETFLKG